MPTEVRRITAGHPVSRTKVFREWLTDIGIDLDSTYAVEIGPKFVRAFRYARDEGGKFYLIPGSEDIATLEPEDFEYDALPPNPWGTFLGGGDP